jgi:hypothetical protein
MVVKCTLVDTRFNTTPLCQVVEFTGVRFISKPRYGHWALSAFLPFFSQRPERGLPSTPLLLLLEVPIWVQVSCVLGPNGDALTIDVECTNSTCLELPRQRYERDCFDPESQSGLIATNTPSHKNQRRGRKSTLAFEIAVDEELKRRTEGN